MFHHKRTDRFALALGVLALTGVLATPDTSAQTTIKYGVTALTVSYAPTLLGGAVPETYAKHGIALDITDFRGNTNNCVAAVLSGAVEVCQVGASSMSDAIAEGGDFKIIALTTGPLGEFVLSAKAVSAMGGVNASSPLNNKLRAMKGLRIVTSGVGTPHYLAMEAALQRAGLGVSDLKFRTLYDPVAIMEGIRNDQIDGALYTVGGLSQVLADKSGVRWINMAAGEIPEVNPLPYVVTMGLTSWIAKNGQTVTRLRAAMSEAVELINKDPAKYSAAIKAKYFPQLNQAIWDDSFKLVTPSFFKGATAPRAGWDYMLKMQAASTKKDYSRASYERAIIPEAQLK